MPTTSLDSPLPRSLPVARPKGTEEVYVKPQVRTMVRYGLFLYFLMVLLEGVFRKWLLPDLNQFIYVAKDAVLVMICGRVILSLGYIPIPASLKHSKVGHLFIAFAIYSFCEGFNLRLPHWKLGIWGIRTYVLPMSLVYLIPLGMPDPRRNEKYFRWYLWLGIPIALLCFAQYQLPKGHIINKYSNEEESGKKGQNITEVRGAVRVTGPFSYITGLTSYAAFLGAGVLGVLFASGWKFKGNKLIWLTLLLTVILVPMTATRALVAYMILYLGILFALNFVLKKGVGGQSKMLIAAICVMALGIGLFGDAFERLAYRARTSSDTSSRLQSLFVAPIEFFDEAGLLGFGAAATHTAAKALVAGGEGYWWIPLSARRFEDEAGRVMLDLGAVGLLLYVVLKLAVCTTVYNYIRKFGRLVPLAIPVACLLTASSGMITGMIVSSVGASFYWGMFGLYVAQANATRIVKKS